MSKQKKIRNSGIPTDILSQMLGDKRANIEAVDNYLGKFSTPEDKQAFDNYRVHNILKGLIGTEDDLFNTYEPMKASFNENAKSLTIEDTDTPEQKTGKDIWNRMVKNGGYLPENNWFINRAKETMTAGWGDLINEPFQIFDTGLGLTDEGLSYNGDKLKLSSEESDFLAKAFARDRGQDRDKSFIEKIGETAVSLTMDIPLMLATGGIAGGLMKGLGGATGKALFTASKGFGGYLNKVVQQSINFSILGMPQTVKSLNKGDYGQAAEDVFHNVLMGSLGATTTEAGKLLFANKSIPIIKNILKDSPAFKEEIAGVAGGFGFGFTSSKFAGQTNEDALATGLAFAATHFTSPQAYKRVLSEHKNKGVRIRRAVEGHKFGATEYFQEENGKFHKIDADLFNTEGRIVKMEGYDPIDITKENDAQFPYYNEAVSSIHQTFNEALTKIRREKRGDEMAGRIKKAIGEDKWNEDPGRHQLFADMLSTQLEVEKINKMFSSWKLPEDAKLHNEMIKLSDNYKLPYSEVKRVMLEDIGSYIRNPEAFTENLFRENIFGEQFVKDYNKSLEMAHKLLSEGVDKNIEKEVASGKYRNYEDKKINELYNELSLRVSPKRLTSGVSGKLESGKLRRNAENVLKSGQKNISDYEAMVLHEKIKSVISNTKFPETNAISRDPKGTLAIKQLEEKLTPLFEGDKIINEAIVTDLIKDANRAKDINKLGDLYSKVLEHNKDKGINTEFTPEEIKKEKVKTLNEVRKNLVKQLSEVESGTPKEAIIKSKVKENDIERKNIETEKIPDKVKKADKKIEQQEQKGGESVKPNDTSETKAEVKEDKQYNTKDEIDNRKAEIIKEVQKGQKVKEAEALEMVLAKNTDARKPTERTKELIKEYNELDKKSIELKSKQNFAEKSKGSKTTSVKSERSELVKKRIKNLQEDFNKRGSKPSDFKDVDKNFAKKLSKYKLGKSYKVSKIAKDFNLNPSLNFMYKLMDKLGIDFIFTDKTYAPALFLDKTIVIGKPFFSDEIIGVKKRYESRLQGNKETLSELIAHEMMHPILKSPKFADLREKGEKLAEEIYAQYKKDIDGEKIDFNLDERIQYMTGQDVLPGERPFGFEELFAIGLNEPAFARYLDSIPSDIKIDNKPLSMFGRLKDIVRSMYERILGKGEASKLDELSNLLDNMLTNENKTDTKPNQLDRLGGVTDRSLNDNSKPIQNHTEQLKTRLTLRYGNKIEQGFASLKHDKREVGERKLDNTEDALKYTKLMADVQMEDTRQAEKSKTLMTGKEAWNIVSKSDKLISLYTGLQKYADLNVPPVFYASMSKKFQDLVYAPGEEMIRGIPLAINTILLDLKNWNGGKLFSELIGDFKNPTPEGQHFLDSFRAYERGRESGAIDKELTWDEFADNFNMSAKERKVLSAYRNGLDAAITRMKDLKAKHIVEFTENPADGLGKKAVSRLLGNRKIGNKELAKARAELNARSQEDMELKKAIADEIVNKQYRGWGTKVYYNSIRPIDPKMWMVDLVKKSESLVESTGETEETSKRISTYFESKEEASQFIKDKAIDGYVEVEGGGFHQIKDLISNKEHYNKLNAHQLMELANAGHIPLTNDIIKQLMDATKGGVDLHTIRKEYIEGMKYTAEEFENQFDRFVREAIYGGSKAYALTKIDRNLEKWQSDIDPLLKTTGHRQKEAKRAKDEFEYAQRYANQLRQAEHSYVDGIRGVAINFQVGGIKPSFIFQQASQVFQTTFHQGIADAKKTGLTTGDAIKSFNKALGRSIKAGVKLRAINNGEEYADADMSAETVELLQKLERMNKIGGTGISELTSEIGDLEHKYEDNVIKKNLQSLQKIMNITGKSVEKWSRIQTALTFEDIGRKQGLKGDDLLNFMADGIDKSLAEWGKGGRAPIFDSKIANTNRTIFTNSLAKSFLTYKTFSYYNYGMWRSMIRNRQFSALASKIVIGTGMHGITKFPLFAAAGMIADLFFDDDELDWKMWQIADNIDEIVPEAGGILHRGVGSVFGIDFRDTFGETTPLAPDLYANAWSDTWQGKLVELSLGAPFGFTQDAVKGVSAFKDWAWDTITNNTTSTEKDFAKAKRAWLRASPVFIRNVFNAFTLKENGLQMNGKTMVFNDELSTYDIVAKAMSFPIDKLTRGYAEYSGGVEKQYARAKQILKKGATHRKEFIQHLRKEGIEGEAYTTILREEMKRVAKDMREARLKIKELEPQVKLLKRKRKQSTNQRRAL